MTDPKLQVALKTWVAAVNRLPPAQRGGISEAFKSALNAIYLAGYTHAVDKLSKATKSVSDHGDSIVLQLPADGLSVNVNQQPREVVLERDGEGRVTRARTCL